MKVGTITQTNLSIQSYSSVELARLVLWHYAVSDEIILQLSSHVQGNTCLVNW